MLNINLVPKENKYMVCGIGFGGFFHRKHQDFIGLNEFLLINADGDDDFILSREEVLKIISNTSETEDKWLNISDVVWVDANTIKLINNRRSNKFE